MRKTGRFLCGIVAVLGLVFAAFPAQAAPKRVVKIEISGMIDRGLAPYIERVLRENAQADAIILEINTLGGLVDSAMQIRDALLNTNVPTIAFINKRAISAGALISFAATHIVMSPGASIGAATPMQIDISGKGNPVNEKYLSYFRTEMRATAEKTGRRGDIAEAMVDADVEIEGISEKGKLLTLTTDEAIKYGIAEDKLDNFAAVLAKYNLSDADIVTTTMNWAEQVVRVLTAPGVSIIIMMLGFLGVFIEFKTPGFGWPGTIGVICLSLFFWGHFLVRLVGWEEIILFTAGVILLMLELLVIPGFGIVGILGIVAIFSSLVMSLVGRFDLLTLNDLVNLAIAKVMVAFIGSMIFAIVFFKIFPRTSVGKQVILQESEAQEDGYVAQKMERGELIGQTGVTLTWLHPSGTAIFDGRRFDVVTEGEVIEKDREVEVIDVEGMRIVVREIKKEAL